MTTLSGKKALVTGASRGIGRAIAIRLAKAGASVALHYGANRDKALAAVAEIEQAGGHAFAVGADIKDAGAIRAMFKELAERDHSPLDILVNNAGVGLGGRLADTSEADFDKLFDTNVRGPFFVTQTALPHLRDGGAVVNISSMVAAVAYPDCIAYSMTKGAVNTFTRSLSTDLARRRIRVNGVAPGATATDFLSSIIDNPAIVAALEGMTALGRMGQPEDIAGVVEFLVSPAGAWVTGQVIQASGGMHL